MRWVERFRMAMLMLFRRKAETERLNRELEFHLEQQIAENIGRGMEPEQARFSGVATLWNPTLLREEARTSWSWNWLEDVWRDLRYGARTLWRSPGFCCDSHFSHGPGHWRDNVAVHDCALRAAEAAAVPRARQIGDAV